MLSPQSISLLLLLPFARGCIRMIPTVNPVRPSTTTSTASTTTSTAAMMTTTTASIKPCTTCTEGSFYQEEYTCTATDEVADGQACQIIPASEAFTYSTVDGCLEAAFICPAGSFYSITAGGATLGSQEKDTFTTEWGTVECDDNAAWVLELDGDTSAFTSVTCYNKVPCTDCSKPIPSGTSSTNCPTTGWTCSPLAETTTTVINGCRQPLLNCTGFVHLAFTLITGTVVIVPSDLLVTKNPAVGINCVDGIFQLTYIAEGVYNVPVTAAMCAAPM